ncbi:hypothetical protein MYXA107069_19550 [Myxococcus xanthus]|nr:hypothetical protein [Myxococcus xanthus]NOJ53101.1 hypothetical protein [Myxococcus xanthus]QPM80067.1 hypothetical protein I5Q59_01825 [Myxococcus xanthus]QVW69131.1 hypothetical protein JTM82_06115 [Myxococcus xanthus DZ2]QZZ47903.1 hypothetical protein MyxoNM_01735 [Myxococcus xanthus]UEO04741.1 hypothetical protein K1515_36695 [Myxococcus xanthus DZ2]
MGLEGAALSEKHQRRAPEWDAAPFMWKPGVVEPSPAPRCGLTQRQRPLPPEEDDEPERPDGGALEPEDDFPLLLPPRPQPPLLELEPELLLELRLLLPELLPPRPQPLPLELELLELELLEPELLEPPLLPPRVFQPLPLLELPLLELPLLPELPLPQRLPLLLSRESSSFGAALFEVRPAGGLLHPLPELLLGAALFEVRPAGGLLQPLPELLPWPRDGRWLPPELEPRGVVQRVPPGGGRVPLYVLPGTTGRLEGRVAGRT